MFPTQGDLHVAPFTDEALYMEQFSKANFWYQDSFHGINLTSLRDEAVKEYFKQPIVVIALDFHTLWIIYIKWEAAIWGFVCIYNFEVNWIELTVYQSYIQIRKLKK